MIRIQSGRFKGRNIVVPDIKAVKPTKNIVRSAVFNMLRHRIDFSDYGFCDVFAGSGIMGFEALSNGCPRVYFYDVSGKVCETLKQNTKRHYDKETVFIHNKDIINDDRFFKENPVNMIYFLDPPYAKTELIYRFMSRLAQNSSNSHIFIESDSEIEANRLPAFKLLNQKQYGHSKIFYFSD